MLVGRFQLDPAAGLALRAAIDAHSAPSPTEDGLRDPRAARQRRADALVRVAETARAVSAPVRGEPVRVVVHVTAEQLSAPRPPGATAWAESGEGVDRGTARRLACDAVLQRVVLGPSAGPLDLGREVRLASRTQRRAPAVRDRGCVVPGCGAAPAACDAHHVRHWADGGPTDLGNLCLLCRPTTRPSTPGRGRSTWPRTGSRRWWPPWVDPGRRRRRLWHRLLDQAVRATGEPPTTPPPGAPCADRASGRRRRRWAGHPAVVLPGRPPRRPAGCGSADPASRLEVALLRLLDTG